MDSLTQIALGAAVGYATLGRHVGRRALVWGAALGTLPDLDVLVPMGGVVEDYTYHRSWSHSLVVLTAISPLCAWLASRVHPATRDHVRGWFWLALLVFVTHVLLDSFTVYGTQIFWPWPSPPESWSTIFIIDPAYTVPLLVGIVCAWIWSGGAARRARRVNAAGLVLSTAYLAWTVVAKVHVEDVVERQLARDGIVDARVLTTPTPFNSLLWRIVLVRDEEYAEGYYSLVADDADIEFEVFASETELLDGMRDDWSVARLEWFTHGVYSVSRNDAGDVVITDLRMGSEPDYVFRFVVGATGSAGTRPVTPRRVSTFPGLDRMPRIWNRIWDPSAAVR